MATTASSSVDPLTKSYPWYTPYQFAGNKFIWAVDRDGLEDEWYMKAWDKVKKGTAKLVETANSIAEKTASSVTLVATSISAPVINQVNIIRKEGIHEGSAYDPNNNVSWAVPYKVQGWKPVPQKQLMNENISYEDGKELLQATANTVALALPVKVPVGSTGSVVLDKTIQAVGTSVIKSTAKN